MNMLKPFFVALLVGAILGMYVSGYHFIVDAVELKPKKVEPYKVPEIDIQEKAKPDNQPVKDIFDRILPNRDKFSAPTEESEQEKMVKEVVDKTLKPNFQRFDSEHQVTLAGIFREDRDFAVLQLLNYQSQQSSYQKLYTGDSLKSFTLSKIGETGVILSRDNETLELKLFKKNTEE